MRGYLDASLLGGSLSALDVKITEVDLKALFEGIDVTNEEELVFNLLLKKCVEISDTLDVNLSAGRAELLNVLNIFARSHEHTVFQVFNTLLSLFLKENWTGPSFLSRGIAKKLRLETQTKKQEIKTKTYPQYDFTELAKKLSEGDDATKLTIPADINTYNYKYIKTPYFLKRFDAQLIDSLEVDSENWPRLMPLTHVFLVIKDTIEFLRKRDEANPIYVLYSGRVHFIHQQMLYMPTGTLYPLVIDAYAVFFRLLKAEGLKLPR